MKNKILYTIWAALFILCAGLGFIPQSTGFGKAVLCAVGILFFVPGAMLLYFAIQSGEQRQIRRIRYLSLLSLGSTCIVLVLNFLCASASSAVGNVLNALLAMASCPMFCCRYWVVSLFLWGCLLSASFTKPVKSAG